MTGREKGRNGWHAGTIEDLPSGRKRWRVRVTYPDGTKERRQGTARTRTEAQRAIVEAQTEAQVGRKPVAASLTVGEMVTEYMAGKAASWAPRTAWNNEALYKRHILPHLAHLKAAGVDARRFRAYFEALGADGLGHSGQRQIHVLLSGAYKRAIGDGLLRDNPALYARPVKAAKSGVAKIKAFTPQQAGRFFEVAKEDRWALPLAFLAVTGMRIGEALALTWGDLAEDPDVPGAWYVTVSKTRSEFEGKYYEGKPKTAAGARRVYLGGDALGILEDMRRRVTLEAGQPGYHGQVGPDSPIFPSVDGRHMRQDTARAVMRRTCERAGVPMLSPHALRHTFASVMHGMGQGVAGLSAHLGHAQISTTLNLYRTVFEAERRGVVLNLSGLRDAESAREEAQAPARSMPRRPRKAGPRRKASVPT